MAEPQLPADLPPALRAAAAAALAWVRKLEQEAAAEGAGEAPSIKRPR